MLISASVGRHRSYPVQAGDLRFSYAVEGALILRATTHSGHTATYPQLRDTKLLHFCAEIVILIDSAKAGNMLSQVADLLKRYHIKN